MTDGAEPRTSTPAGAAPTRGIAASTGRAAITLFVVASLCGWLAGAVAFFAVEVSLLADLPRLPLGALVGKLAGGALRAIPLGLLAAAGLAAVAGFLPRTRARAVIRLASWQAALGRAGFPALVALVASLAPVWLGGVSLLVPAVVRPGSPLQAAEGRRVVLLGMDGAVWSVIDDMRERGDLPNIDRLIARGVRAKLRSLEPTLSNRVWTSAITGVVPDRHGITDFFFDRRFIQVPTIWDLVHREGGRVGLYKFLVTDPPLPFNGFVMPGWLAQGWRGTCGLWPCSTIRWRWRARDSRSSSRIPEPATRNASRPVSPPARSSTCTGVSLRISRPVCGTGRTRSPIRSGCTSSRRPSRALPPTPSVFGTLFPTTTARWTGRSAGSCAPSTTVRRSSC